MRRPPPGLSDQLVSSCTGPVFEVREIPGEPWQPPGICVGAAGVATDAAHSVVRKTAGLGHGATFEEARHKALHEFAERLVLGEPPADGGRDIREEAADCPLAGRSLRVECLTTGTLVDRPAGEWFLHPPSCPAAQRPDRPSTNGAAAGGSSDEAAERALLELLERDALMVTWRYGLRRPRWTPGPELAAGLARLRARGLTATFADLSQVHGVPTVLCLVKGGAPSLQTPAAAVGSAADRTMARAAERSLDEAARVLGVLARDDRSLPGEGVPYYDDFLDNARFHLAPARAALLDRLTAGPPADEPAPALQGSPAEVVGALMSRLRPRGVRVFRMDLTPPWMRALGVHVVVTRSPDLYPLEAGPGDPVLAERLGGHHCRAGLTAGCDLDLAPVPLA